MAVRASKGQQEDSYQRLLLNDFAGGLNTYIGAMSLPSNASPDMLNVIPLPGRLKYRGGYSAFSALLYTADQAYQFYDTTGARHIAIWAYGNLYDVTSGAPVTVASAVYTVGQRVGVCDISGLLYWSTQTVALQYWNPVTSTAAAVVQTGANTPPSSPYLFVYTGSIVALGVNYTPGTPADYQPTVMGWSGTNAPGSWNAASSQAVGPLIQGATLEFGIPLGIADTGVPLTRTILVGRSDRGIISYTGALGSLTENAVNCPVGVLDGASAVYCPGASAFGEVLFLGSDGQFWQTNGINCQIASLDIQNLVQTQVGYSGSGYRFWAGYNEEDSYYFCNVGSFQFCYKWDIKKWTVFAGWPNGPIINGTNSVGAPACFVASNVSTNLGVFQLGIPQTLDNGVPPPPVYYKTPYLHAGDPELLKIWAWISLLAYNTNTTYQVTGQCLARANDGSIVQSGTLTFATAGTNGNNQPFILNQSLLNGPNVLANGTTQGQAPVAPPQTPVMMHGRLSAPVTWEEDSMCRGIFEMAEAGGSPIQEDLYGTAVQFTIQWLSGTIDFQILGIQTRYTSRGYRREGGLQYDAEMGVSNPNDSFVYNNLTPVDPEQSG